MPGRLAKLEGAISKQRTVKFDYWSISRDELADRTRQPVRAAARQRRLVRRRLRPRPRRHPHVPRLAHPRRDQVRDPARARLPHARPTSTSSSSAAGRRGRSARSSARRASRCAATPPGGCSARTGSTGRLEDGIFVTDYSSLPQLASLGAAPGRPRRPARARGAAPRGGGVAAPRARRPRGQGARARPRVAACAPPTAPPTGPPARLRPSASPCSRRCSPTCSPPAARARTR